MWNLIKKKLRGWGVTSYERDRIAQAVHHLNSAGYDPWGVDPETLAASLGPSLWFYRNYFRVETVGIQQVPTGRVMLVPNHSGQVPVDGMLLGISMLLQADPPRLVRGMVERWAPTVPFVGTFFSRTGQIVGDVKNCLDLLEHDEAVMVFPEGANGSGKTIFHRYELQKFGTGFLRLALETRTPIVPVAVIGCEEMLPSVSSLGPIAKLLKAPYFPLIPTGYFPLPTKVTIRYGAPLRFDEDPRCSDQVIDQKIQIVRQAIESELKKGLEARADRVFTASAKLEGES